MEYLADEELTNLHCVWLEQLIANTPKLIFVTILYKGELCLTSFHASTATIDEITSVPVFKLTNAEKIRWIEKQQSYEREFGFCNSANFSSTELGCSNSFSYINFNTPAAQIEEMFNTIED